MENIFSLCLTSYFSQNLNKQGTFSKFEMDSVTVTSFIPLVFKFCKNTNAFTSDAKKKKRILKIKGKPDFWCDVFQKGSCIVYYYRILLGLALGRYVTSFLSNK